MTQHVARAPGPARFAGPADGRLDDAMRAAFACDGCLVIEDFVDAAACDRLIARAAQLVREADLNGVPTVFSTTNPQRHGADAYFATSGDKIRFFFEAGRGTLVVLHGMLPHFSGPNRSQHSRHAYSLHVIDGTCRYLDDNWLQRAPDMPLRGFGESPAVRPAG